MNFITRYSFPFYVFYGICSFLAFFIYSLEGGNSLFVAFVFACIAGAIFILLSALFILPFLFIVAGLLFELIGFAFRRIRF